MSLRKLVVIDSKVGTAEVMCSVVKVMCSTILGWTTIVFHTSVTSHSVVRNVNKGKSGRIISTYFVVLLFLMINTNECSY